MIYNTELSRKAINLKKIVTSAVIVTLVATPWVSSDALIVPKIIFLSVASFYFLPKLVLQFRKSINDKSIKILFALSLLFVAQMIIVMLNHKEKLNNEKETKF